MGSVAEVYTGNLSSSEVNALITGQVSDNDGRIPDIVRVYVDNEDETTFFDIDLRGCSQEDRERFLKDWKRAANIHDKNAKSAYDNAYDAAIKAGASQEQAERLGNLAKANASYNALKRIEEKGKIGIKVKKTGF